MASAQLQGLNAPSFQALNAPRFQAPPQPPLPSVGPDRHPLPIRSWQLPLLPLPPAAHSPRISFPGEWRSSSNKGSSSSASNYSLPAAPLGLDLHRAVAASAGPSTRAQGGTLYLSDLLKGQWAWLLVMIALSISQTSSAEI